MRFLIRWFFRSIRLILTPFLLLGNALTAPRPVERDAPQQAAIDAATAALALYHYPTCPFCIKVRRTIRRQALDIELRDAQHDSTHRARLEAEGGRIQVPALTIDDGDSTIWLYESNAINAYLERRFAGPDAPRPHVEPEPAGHSG